MKATEIVEAVRQIEAAFKQLQEAAGVAPADHTDRIDALIEEVLAEDDSVPARRPNVNRKPAAPKKKPAKTMSAAERSRRIKEGLAKKRAQQEAEEDQSRELSDEQIERMREKFA